MTDIWAWVHEAQESLAEAGHHRLAAAIRAISGHAVHGRVDELEALYPEALAAARSLGLPWVELYLRHWRMQSLVNHRQQGAKVMPDAVALLEYAHRDETRDCPQAVCAVQDFTLCHARADGPGYARERLAVLDETLPRVDDARACFDCLSREYSSALDDDGRPEEALEHITAAIARHRAAGAHPSLYMLVERARVLGVLDRVPEALAELDRAERECRNRAFGIDEDDERTLALHRAGLHARLGHAASALAHLAGIEEAHEHPDIRVGWALAVERLAALGAYENTAALGAALVVWAGHLQDAGTHRDCLTLLLVAARLATARGARAVARTTVALAAGKLGDLRRPDAASHRAVAAAREAADAMPAPELPVEPAETAAHVHRLGESFDGGYRPADPERELDLLDAAAERLPGDAELTIMRAQYLTLLGLPVPAAALLWGHVESEPAGAASDVLADTLIRAGDVDGIARLAGLLAPGEPARAHWLRANFAAARSEWADCVRECAAVIALEPEAVNTRRLWADAAGRLRDLPTWQRLAEEILARVRDDEDAAPDRRAVPADHWRLAVSATANGDWPAVHRACAGLGIEPRTPEGPIDEAWHPVELRHTGADGHIVVLALRTGPATVRVVSVTQPGAPLNHGDLVLVDPSPIEPPPEDEDERAGWYPAYASLSLLAPGGFMSYLVDGVHPGEAAWEAFAEGVRRAGYGLWVYTGDDYEVVPPDAPAPVPGIAAGLAVPPVAKAVDAVTLLESLTAAWEHPMAWPSLAEAAGVDVERHREIVERYGL